jgi:type I restriction enzyme S subunit
MQGDAKDAIRLLRGINVGVGDVTWDESVHYPESDRHRFSRYELAAGDIVIGMDRPIIKGGLRVAQITDTDLPALLVQRVARIRAQRLTGNGYLKFVLSSGSFIDHISPSMTGVSVPHVSEEQIMSFRFPLPPADVQEAITRELNHLELLMRRTSRALERQIVLLRERRQALITAAVTGQLDIAEAA